MASSRAERRKSETRERLLDAALDVFLARGYDGATTTAIARAADLGAGTFYLHFRDKRAAFEGIAHRVARSVLDPWRAAIGRETSIAAGVGLALEMTARFWHAHRDQARLLLEDGPSFGTAAHMRLIEDFTSTLESHVDDATRARLGPSEARALGALVVGLAIEIGRLVLGSESDETPATVASMIALARRAATPA
jgi:AcrR family transcriptional regulator